MTNYNIYFSPTGGTKRVADILSGNLFSNYNVIDLCSNIDAINFTKNDVCLISIPSYGGRVPTIAIERIKKMVGNGAKAILNCVYGNREWEDTLTELQDTLVDLGFICIAAVAAVCEHSIFRQYGKGRPNYNDEKELIEYSIKIKNKLASNVFDELILEGNHNVYKIYNGPSLIPQSNDTCTKCGLCALKCPALAIDSNNSYLTNKNLCIGCMRCVNICPNHARDFDVAMMDEKSKIMEPKLSGYKKNYLFL